MFRALTLAALLAATTMPALAQTSAANSTDVSAPPASTPTKPSATMNKAAPAATPTMPMTNAAPMASTTTRSAAMTTAAPVASTTTTTTTGAAAATSPAMVKVMQTCQADFAKACPGIAPAAPEMRTCVTTNFSSLGEPCQGAIMEMMNAGGAG